MTPQPTPQAQAQAASAATRPASPWLVAVEAVNQPKQVLRARMQAQYGRAGRQRHEAVEWQAGKTLGIYYTILAVAGGGELELRIVAPGHNDELHLAANGGTGNLADHYPAVLCGRAPRPDGWPPNHTVVSGRARGDHQRAAWAVAMRAAMGATGRPWEPRALLGATGLPPTVGIDPGADWTGLVACVGAHVLGAATVGRAACPKQLTGYDVDRWYVGQVVATLANFLTAYRPAAEAARANVRLAEQHEHEQHELAPEQEAD